MQAIEELISSLDIASDLVSGYDDNPRPKEAGKIVMKTQKGFNQLIERIEKILGHPGKGAGHVRYVRYRLERALVEAGNNSSTFMRDHLISARASLRELDKALSSALG
jgi:hypothetical protein